MVARMILGVLRGSLELRQSNQLLVGGDQRGFGAQSPIGVTQEPRVYVEVDDSSDNRVQVVQLTVTLTEPGTLAPAGPRERGRVPR